MKVKDEVIKMLEESRNICISGEEMAEKLGVSRNAVWKAVNSLREEGHDIVSDRKKGYYLSQESDVISEAGVKKYLKTDCFGHKLVVFAEIDSTNNYAKKIAEDGAEEGVTVIADHQAAGKGRLGRKFYSPEKSGIYMTVVLRPKFGFEKAGLITSMAAVAVAHAVDKLSGLDTKIKWVNDIYVNDKKLCGILTEASTDFETQRLQYAVLGIGINVAKNEFPEEIASVATSIENECTDEKKISRNELIAEVLLELEKGYAELNEDGAEMSFLEESRKKSYVLGKEVQVIDRNGGYFAKAVDIDSKGRLIVEKEGERTALNSGEISIRLKQ